MCANYWFKKIEKSLGNQDGGHYSIQYTTAKLAHQKQLSELTSCAYDGFIWLLYLLCLTNTCCCIHSIIY